MASTPLSTRSTHGDYSAGSSSDAVVPTMSTSRKTTSALDDFLIDESKSLWDEFDLFAEAETMVIQDDGWSEVELFDLLEHDDLARLQSSSEKMLPCRAGGLAKALPKPKRERETKQDRRLRCL